MKKILKSMLLSSGIILLACVAFSLPRMIHDWGDQEQIGKINYVSNDEIDIFKYENFQTMEDKLNRIGNIYYECFFENYAAPEVISIGYFPKEHQSEEIENAAIEGIRQWIGTKGLGISFNGYSPQVDDSMRIKEISLYSIMDYNITYYKIVMYADEWEDTIFTVYMDSASYKLYLLSIAGNGIDEWMFQADEKGYDRTKLFSVIFSVEEKIQLYYNLDREVLEEATDRGISFSIGEYLRWSVDSEFSWDTGSYELYIGIRGFENGFLYVPHTDVKVSKSFAGDTGLSDEKR